ncbi:hypothetical protein [Massilia niastensis]|uniref:hypothetical protein n=1 Tax=Massilia niastensis TaxID=544911 RepID=UPI0003673CD4|nr:hypothetical protein [Massilia niastensis]
MTTSAYPQFTAVSVQLNTQPYQDAFSKITKVYADSIRANTEQLWLSSTQIVQEETIKAFVSASQSCMEALAKNAESVTQQSFGRLVDANQKAFEIMGQVYTDTMTGAMKPAR